MKEVESTYITLTNILKELREHDINIIMGQFKKGEDRTSDRMGPHGLRVGNKTGDTLEVFVANEHLV